MAILETYKTKPVFKAIKFTGKNGKEVRDFLDAHPVVTRAGNGWVKLNNETFLKDTWFLYEPDAGLLTTMPDSVLRVYYKRLKSNDPTRWVLKDNQMETQP